MNRRTFLSTAALLGATGCTGLDSDTEDASVSNQGTETAIGATDQRRTQPSPSPEPETPAWSARFIEYDSDFVEDSVGVQIEAVRQADALRLADGDLVETIPEKKLLLIKIRTTNLTDSRAPRPPRSSFTLNGGIAAEAPMNVGAYDNDSPVVDFPWPGTVYQSPPPAEPGETMAGWLVFDVWKRSTRERFYYQDTHSEGKQAVWELGFESANLQEFHVHDIESTTRNERGDTALVHVTIENIGSTPALLREQYTLSVGEDRRWHKGTLTEAFEPGETKTIIEKVPVKPATEFTFHLGSIEAERLTAPPTSIQFGDSFTTHAGAEVTVSSPTLSETISLSGEDGNPRRSAKEDHTFAVFEVSVRNTTQQVQPRVESSWFQAQVDEFESGPRYFDATGLSKPIEGEYYMSSRFYPLQGGNVQSGVIHCSVPAETTLEDLVFRASFPMQTHANDSCEWSTNP